MKKLFVFAASWCGPCKNVKRVLDMVTEHSPTPPVDIVYYDLDKDSPKFDEFSVTAVPTLVLLDENEVELKRNTGAMTLPQLKELLS